VVGVASDPESIRARSLKFDDRYQLCLLLGDKDLLLSSGVGGSTEMPRTTADGIDNLLLSFLIFFTS